MIQILWRTCSTHSTMVKLYLRRSVNTHPSFFYKILNLILHFSQGFLHCFSDLRNTATRHLLFLFLVSHIVVVTNPNSNFDLNYIQLFKTLESVRLKLQTNVAEILKTVPGLPKVNLTIFIYIISSKTFFKIIISGLAKSWSIMLSSRSLLFRAKTSSSWWREFQIYSASDGGSNLPFAPQMPSHNKY